MAEITIVVKDIEGGKVSIRATPSFEMIMKMDISGNKLTPAHGYAVALLNKAREISKSNDPRQIIQVPRLKPGRMH